MKTPDPFLTRAGRMLGPIKGYTSLIQDDSKPGSNARWWADKIMRDVETLERELECSGMLTLEGPEAAPASWRSVIERALSHVRILNTNAQIDIHNQAQSEFVARGELISRALFQVLRNACEAVGNTGSVRVEVTESRDENEPGTIYRVVVEDDGPGIPRSDIENACRPFVSTKPGHRGLGLPYVESVARHIGMGVNVESGSGGGTRVTMKLRVEGDEQ